ncbi:hypothetical protein C0J52_17647 [Blattella germanica]|nr:hypothetical protein C0J52_17647 [Blattella germanica]
MDSDLSVEYEHESLITEPKKRRRSVENCKINKKNMNIHSSNASKQCKINCKHDTSFCMALKLTEDQITDFNMHYWSNRDAVFKENF